MPIQESLLEAIEKYLEGTASEEERKLVQAWYYAFDDETVEIPSQVIELRKLVAEKIWNRLTETITGTEAVEKAPVYQLKRNTYRRWLAAASIVIMLAAGGYFYFINRSAGQPAVLLASQQNNTHDVAPGGNKALLTLSDGSIVVLDTMRNGTISNQGNTRVLKLNSGQLAYNTADGGKTAVVYNTITTPNGGQFQVILEDGTHVWLNAASSLRYPTVFTGHERKVELTGEAYFEVAKNADKPFRVMINGLPAAEGMNIKVLGTHFNINAYADEPAVKTTLLEGAVEVHQAAKPAVMKLQPGQQAQLNTGGELKLVKDADVEEAVAWRNGRFLFAGADVKTILRQVVRWYDVTIEFEGQIPQRFFTADISRNTNLSEMMQVLELSNIHYKIEGRTLTILP